MLMDFFSSKIMIKIYHFFVSFSIIYDSVCLIWNDTKLNHGTSFTISHHSQTDNMHKIPAKQKRNWALSNPIAHSKNRMKCQNEPNKTMNFILCMCVGACSIFSLFNYFCFPFILFVDAIASNEQTSIHTNGTRSHGACVCVRFVRTFKSIRSISGINKDTTAHSILNVFPLLRYGSCSMFNVHEDIIPKTQDPWECRQYWDGYNGNIHAIWFFFYCKRISVISRSVHISQPIYIIFVIPMCYEMKKRVSRAEIWQKGMKYVLHMCCYVISEILLCLDNCSANLADFHILYFL